MAYVLTSLRERETSENTALKIVVHLDSYKHWFYCEIDSDDTEKTKSRPDFLVLEAMTSDNDILHLKATVVECKIAGLAYAEGHKEKAINQVKHGISVLTAIFNPNSTSIKRRYWFAQLYRALAFSHVTFSDNSSQFADLSSKLRSILDGNFEIEWSGKVLGFWIDKNGENETENNTDTSSVKVFDIPQQRIQKLLLQETEEIEYVSINTEEMFDDDSPFFEPDELSGRIIASYQRHLRGKNRNFDELCHQITLNLFKIFSPDSKTIPLTILFLEIIAKLLKCLAWGTLN